MFCNSFPTNTRSFLSFWIKGGINIFLYTGHWPLPWTRQIHPTCTHDIYAMRFKYYLIIYAQSSKRYLPLRVFYQNFVRIINFSHSCCMHGLSRLFSVNHSNNIRWRVYIIMSPHYAILQPCVTKLNHPLLRNNDDSTQGHFWDVLKGLYLYRIKWTRKGERIDALRKLGADLENNRIIYTDG